MGHQPLLVTRALPSEGDFEGLPALALGKAKGDGLVVQLGVRVGGQLERDGPVLRDEQLGL